jgi:hypothetical protein
MRRGPTISENDRLKIGRSNAEKLFHLDRP